jgi:hypothetical protein
MMRFLIGFLCWVCVVFSSLGQSTTVDIAESLAAQLTSAFTALSKDRDFKKAFGERQARIMVLPFYTRLQKSILESETNDTTILGQYFSELLQKQLAYKTSQLKERDRIFEFLVPTQNVIFQSNFVYVKPDKQADESAINNKFNVEHQPDFLMSGEYQLHEKTKAFQFLSVTLTRVNHYLNTFQRTNISLLPVQAVQQVSSNALWNELMEKNVKLFNLKVYKQLLEQFEGRELAPLTLYNLKLDYETRSFTLDSAVSELTPGSLYKMGFSLPADLFVYAFTYERFDADKKYLYFIKAQKGNLHVKLKSGHHRIPGALTSFGFQIPEHWQEGYPVYFKVFATEEPLYLNAETESAALRHQEGQIEFLSPENASKFLKQLQMQLSKGKVVYTSELTKYVRP